MNTNIIPAIMPDHFDDIEMMAGLAKNFVSTVQLDIMDGNFVPEKTWPFNYGTDRDLHAILDEEASLPFWDDINYELDLMIERPEESLDTWLHVGASRVIFHYASVHQWEVIKNIDPVVRDFISLGCAITIHDNIEDIFPLIDEKVIDFIQVMGIAHIGYQGEPFEEASLDIIKQLHEKYPELIISVDGGVSLDTIGSLSDAGAVRFVSGSAVYGTGIVNENINNLLEAIEK